MTTNEGEFVIDGAGDDVAAASASEGGVTFTGPGGQTRLGSNIDLDDAPEWLPIYPGSSDVQMPFVTSSANGRIRDAIGLDGATRSSKSWTIIKTLSRTAASQSAT